MRKRKLITQLFTSYIILAVVAIMLIIYFSSKAVEKFYLEQKVNDLRARSELVIEVISLLEIHNDVALQDFCQRIGITTHTRVTIISPDGLVLADSEEDPHKMDNHGDRPEVLEAMGSGEGLSQRHSYTLDQEHLYYAKSISIQNEKLILRVSFSTLALDEALWVIKKDLMLIGMVVVFLIAVLNWYLSGLITKPIKIMESGAKRFAKGKLKVKVPESSISELGSLARSLNEMAEEIYTRIRTITYQKSEQIAILSSMTEGVIALDPDGVILSANRAAADMFGVKAKKVINRKLYEVIRHAELNQFVTNVLKRNDTIQRQIPVYGQDERKLNVIGSRMPAKKGAVAGAVIVLTDLTHVLKLESLRRDFVANVSHELKTPVTSIQGYVETLQDGAINEPDNAERFLEIISKHADRLGQIIDDLLELSRIEEMDGQEAEYFENVAVEKVFNAAIQNYHALIKHRSIDIQKDVEPDLMLMANAKLVSHAVGNLLDNAIKYSNEGSLVTLRGFRKNNKIILEVMDQGVGIDPLHLERIFERFYRIDKGRSREVGGTGLGLSIVKHIARVHQAKVDVKSKSGKGSSFRIIFVK